jgi:predicted amidohydrolase YtcJ
MWMMVHANGYALDAKGQRFEAVVVDGERIVAVGSTADLMLQFASRVDGILDLQGATVVPGLVDSHMHIAAVGEQALKLNLSGVRSKQALLDRVDEWARRLAPDEWVLGGGWDDNRFVDRILPTLEELNGAAGGRPMLLNRICQHAFLANSAALHLAGIDINAPDPPDGRYGRSHAGELTGLIYENAVRPILRVVPKRSKEQWKVALRAGMEMALKAGLTAVHTDDVRSFETFADTWETFYQLIHEDQVKLRVHELVDWHYLDEIPTVRHLLPKPDHWLQIGAAKLFADGAMGGSTAWLSAPYSDAPGWTGTPIYTPAELMSRIRSAREKGFASAVHAIGDAALDTLLTILEALPRGPLRDRIIHAEVIRPDLVERMAALGDRVVVDIQPRFTVSDFPWIADRLGDERIANACAWKTLKDAGLFLAGGSDAPIEPLEPLLGIHAAVTRRPPFADGDGYGMAEALSPEEAVRLFSRDTSYASQTETEKGVIAPGWLADFTVLDRDIVFPETVDQIRDANVLYTIVGGNMAYAADGRQVEWSA